MTHPAELPEEPHALRRALLVWYDVKRRALPWRALRGETVDPYGVWLSEVMLQQTTVAAAAPRFRRFMARWPSLASLARADLEEVLHAWQGLGYYARARNLHACARAVVADHGGRLPDDEAGLRALPGIGAYTAAAVAAIAFGRPALPVDANVGRVLARLCAIDGLPVQARRHIDAAARGLAADQRPGDFAQAMMDLGAGVCTPAAPDCARCPWHDPCAARRQGRAAELPVKPPRGAKPLRHGMAFWARRGDGAVLLRRRPPRGLLGGMMEVPSTEWRMAPWSLVEARAEAPLRARWRRLPGIVGHTFTHFRLELSVVAGRAGGGADDGIWCPPERFSEHAMPTLMKKVARHACGAGHG
jgi:A/G-specific adenine glycosylase